MRILALVHGIYGERIVRNIRARAPQGWEIESLQAPRALPIIVEEPEEFLPPTLPRVDLILHLAETHQAAQLLPGVVRLTGARAVIAPVDNPAWLPEGLKTQLRRELAELGAEAVFPRPFCSLTEEGFGFRGRFETYDSEIIARFASRFGRPKFRLKVEKGIIEEVVVERGSPCGSTYIVAGKLKGTPIGEAIPKAGLICAHYPCLASMQPEMIEGRVETLLHISGQIVNEEMETAILRA
ncbi:MAG TPA: hypothetical protein EYP09_12215 [Anaerolineae bacterium]|nr:hypothetical protein [Anaerolineae bacterium]